MPELPDLLYIKTYLEKEACNRTISAVEIRQPIVLRVAVEGKLDDVLVGRTIEACTIHGPFIQLECSGKLDLVMNLMLAGRLQHQKEHEKPVGFLCFSILLDNGTRVNFCDEQKMAKAYLVRHGEFASIPKYREQGVNILSSEFTVQKFRYLAEKHSRKQVRVFINDHTIVSSIGNAYADEILFDAKIHPKTFVARLPDGALDQLYHSIRSVMKWGIEQVESAAQPIHIKVREHMKVRNRKDRPCPHCGTKIRREGVRGFDVFFCPKCQPPTRKLFLDWNRE